MQRRLFQHYSMVWTALCCAVLSFCIGLTSTRAHQTFECGKLAITDVRFSGFNTIYISLQNNQARALRYDRAKLIWNSNRVLNTSLDAYAGFIAWENDVNWTGDLNNANTSPVLTDDRAQGDDFQADDLSSPIDVYIPGLYTTLPASGTARWQLTFIGLSTSLDQVLELWELNGTTIYVTNPETGAECALTVDESIDTGGI